MLYSIKENQQPLPCPCSFQLLSKMYKETTQRICNDYFLENQTYNNLPSGNISSTTTEGFIFLTVDSFITNLKSRDVQKNS